MKLRTEWAGSGRSASGIRQLKCVLHVIDPRFFTLLDVNFDHIEAPWQIAVAKLLQPGVSPALDQALFFAIHGIQRADFAPFAAGFHLDEKQQFAIACDDINLAAFGSCEILSQNLASLSE